MKRIRVIPLMLLDTGRAVVTTRFGKPVYVGDPINAIKIFNEKQVDELIILDIGVHSPDAQPDFQLIEKMASESFMPLAYGGHIKTVEQAERIINSGIEKISFNTALFQYPDVIRQVADKFGKQSVVASIDVKRDLLGRRRVQLSDGKTIGSDFAAVVRHLESIGIGEILLTSIEKDGTRSGFDCRLIEDFTKLVRVPVIACGGAGTLPHFVEAITAGASAVAAGAMFFFKGDQNAILINYPDQNTLRKNVYCQL